MVSNPVYQYFYDKERRPRVTVCYLDTDDTTYVGIAVCSMQDMPCKRIGRNLALERAHLAQTPPYYVTAIEYLWNVFLGATAVAIQHQTDMVVHLSPRYLKVPARRYRLMRRLNSHTPIRLPGPWLDVPKFSIPYSVKAFAPYWKEHKNE